MENDPLKSIRWKLWKGGENCKIINDIAQGFLKSDFYTFVPDMDKNGRFIVRIGTVKPIPPMISLLIGETAHHIRSSLDHLMFLMAKPAPGKEDKVQFPLFSSRKKFDAARKISKKGTSRFDDLMPNIPRGVKRLIESVQPYHSRKWPDTRRLGQIQILDNWDKHRMFSTSAASAIENRISFEIISGGKTGCIQSEVPFTGIIKPGQIIGRARPSGYWDAGAKVIPKIELALLPVFDEVMPKGIKGEPILHVLADAGNFVQDTIIPMFEPFISR